MNKEQPSPRILLIRTPRSVSGDASERWAVVESALGGISVNLQINDAATDFFVRVLAGGDHLASHRRQFERAASRFLLNEHRPYEEVLQDSEMINQALSSGSKAFAPCLFHRYGFAHEGLDGLEAVVQFADDRISNPFRRYADHHWRPFDASAPPDMALLLIGRPGEMGPAVTMGLSWINRWPQIPLKLICPEALCFGPDWEAFVKLTDHWPIDVITDTPQLQKTIARTLSLDAISEIAQFEGITPLQKQEGVPLIAEQMPASVQNVLDRGGRLVVWRDCGDETDAVTSQLYAASRKGLWNHLILKEDTVGALGQFAAANSNIVHSYCHEQMPSSMYSDPVYTFPSTTPGYGRTRPMPGMPLWMRLKDPNLIARLLEYDHPKTIMRMRVRDDALSLFEVGKQLSYHFKRADELPAGYLDEIVHMVEAGGSVNTQFVRYNLERAYLITYVEEEGVIVGNSSLKQPREEYIDAVSRQSGIDLHDYLERGYTSVRPEYRGLGVGAKLLEGLTDRAGDHKIFSVIAENNVATQKMAMRNQTRRVATFFSERAKKEMSVWIPEWMLPEGVQLPPQPDLDIGPIT